MDAVTTGGAGGTAAKSSAAALSSTPDLDLATRHRYGDESAFNEVFERYSSMVFNLALRMVGSEVQAEDLAQEIFLRIYRHLGRFNGRSTLKTWIYRVAVNHCRSRLSRKRFFFLPIADEHDDEDVSGIHLVDTGRDPEDLALATDAGRRLARALRELKPVFREAVVLRDLEGLAYDEIAEVLKVRIGTVRSRIARGREQLREAMERLEGLP